MSLALFDWSELSASGRASSFVDVACILGILACLGAMVAHARSSLRSIPLAGVARIAGRLPLFLLLAALAGMAVCVWHRGVEVNHFPSQTMSEVLQMFSLAMLASMTALHFALGLQRKSSGWAIVDDAMQLVVFAGVFSVHSYIETLSTAQRDLPPALQSYWFPPHLSSLIFSYATMVVAASVALVYFVTRFWTAVYSGQDKLAKKLVLLAALSALLGTAGTAALRFGLGFEWVPAVLLPSLPAGLLAWALMRGVFDARIGGAPAKSEYAICVGLTLIPFVQIVTLPLLLLGGIVFGVLKLTRNLPSPARLLTLEKDLDEVSFRAFAVGIPFLTAGLWMGAFWAQEAWANYWGWDSKENAALITWLVYIVYIHLRMLGGWRGSKAMAVLVGGATSVFITFQLFGYFPDSQKSLHRYTDDNVKPMEGQQQSGPANEQASVDTSRGSDEKAEPVLSGGSGR